MEWMIAVVLEAGLREWMWVDNGEKMGVNRG